MRPLPSLAWMLLCVFALATTAGLALAACPHCQSQAGCCEKDLVEHRCVMKVVKTPIKKVVYECKEVPYCVHAVSKHGDCNKCAACEACPLYKTVLIKKEIVVGEKCETKCVVEEVVRKAVCCQHCQHELSAAGHKTALVEAPLPLDVVSAAR